MKKYSVLVLVLLVFITGCTQNNYSGCRGREGAVKTGPATLYLPYPAGETHTIAQGWYGTFSHNSAGEEHALDFAMNVNDAIYPVQAGRVVAVKKDSGITCSGPCPEANYVVVDHGNGFMGRYFHFCQNCIDVTPGQLVTSATKLGGAGTTGFSTGVHLHFELADWEEGCTAKYGFTNINNGARTSLEEKKAYTSSNPGNTTYVPSKITGNTFKKLGVVLTSKVDWYLAAGDVISVQGNFVADSGTLEISLYNEHLEQATSSIKTQSFSTKSFDMNYTIPSVGTGSYSLSIRDKDHTHYTYNNPPQIVLH